MTSSLVLAACGGADGESLVDSESQAVASQSVVTPSTEDADRRIIVYQTTSLQLMRVDHKGTSHLVAQRTGEPAISSDGKRVAYAKLPDSYRAGDPVRSSELHVLNVSSGKSEQVTQGFDDSQPVWTPDGSVVLFQSTQRSGVPSLWRVKKNGKDLTQVTNKGSRSEMSSAHIPNPALGGTLEWDADRRIIVYTTTSLRQGEDGEVRVIAFDKNYDVASAYSLGRGFAPEWTERGTVVYSRNEGGRVVTIEARVP
ncbi:TolB family protein [Myxococcus sp. Y35]|uniref:TolB family protein n=1 Tax=Pseudomyxococcus flavus TaxID=3115648 RepID=UPI003CEBE863